MNLKAHFSKPIWSENDPVPFQSQPHKKEKSDKALWGAFLKGDEAAFISIYEQYVEVLFNFGCQFTSDRDLVMDCLQDFFIYLREKRTGLGTTDAIKPYLFKAFKRRVVDYIKKQKKQNPKLEENSFKHFPVELSSEAIFIHQQMEKEQIQKLNMALNQLGSKEREAIYYFYYEGLGYDQVAEILGFSHVSSARRLVYRGLAHLRKYFVVCLLLTLWEANN